MCSSDYSAAPGSYYAAESAGLSGTAASTTSVCFCSPLLTRFQQPSGRTLSLRIAATEPRIQAGTPITLHYPDSSCFEPIRTAHREPCHAHPSTQSGSRFRPTRRCATPDPEERSANLMHNPRGQQQGGTNRHAHTSVFDRPLPVTRLFSVAGPDFQRPAIHEISSETTREWSLRHG
jgi:hypothetical protein